MEPNAKALAVRLMQQTIGRAEGVQVPTETAGSVPAAETQQIVEPQSAPDVAPAQPGDPSSQEPTPEDEPRKQPSEKSFDDVLDRMKRAQAEKRELEAQLKTLRDNERDRAREGVQDAVLAEDKPPGWDEWSDEKKAIHLATRVNATLVDQNTLDRVEGLLIERTLQSEHGLSLTQATVVREIMDETPGISQERALVLARTERPEKFTEISEQRQVNQGQRPQQTDARGEAATRTQNQAKNNLAEAWAGGNKDDIRRAAIAELMPRLTRSSG